MKSQNILVIIILTILIHIYTMSQIYKKGEHHYESNRCEILDYGFAIIKDGRDNKELYNYKESLSVIYFVSFVFYLYKNHGNILKEYMLSLCLIEIIKTCLIYVTILPDPSQKCNAFNIFQF